MESVCEKRIIFLVIGYVEWRKGQDVLLSAFKRMSKDIKNKCEFILIGENKSLYAQNIKDETMGISQWKMIGKVDHAQIKEYLEKSDVLVCPSREDPMPTVAAEAMAMMVPCLLSDATGTAAYITDGINGFVFQSGNDAELAEKIEWCVLHPGEVKNIGSNAKKVYQEHFSMEVFEKNVRRVISNVLDKNIRGKSD